ncbi:PAS domain-containing protein [Kiloniella majae]|uniref:PAS domain-containing protein n=1 Tax=Kiloniella majae TaxID=1938558 RepID=UPI000A277CD7|nr:PAS domain-containing protein [Kiloniella majae]
MLAEDSYCSTESLWKRAEEVVREDYFELGVLMQKLGSPKPVLIWNQSPENLPGEQLEYFFKWWHQSRGQNFAASPDAVDPLELRSVLGYLAVLDIIDGGEDFKYRLYGSAIMNEPGKDLTGLLLSDIWTPLRAFFAVTYRAVVLRKEPLYTQHIPHHSLKMQTWDRLILPLSNQHDEVERLIVAIVPNFSDGASTKDDH